MDTQSVKQLFAESKAMLLGHFLLSSGLHSGIYFQSALVLQHPAFAARLASALAEKVKTTSPVINVVVSPALGGIVIGQEMARALGCRAIFCERVDGKLALRRGFSIEMGEKALVVEDVITTGLSTREVVDVIKFLGADVVGVASLVDRSAGKVEFGVPFSSLLSLDIKSYQPDQCPLCKEGRPVVKPGSRAQ
ncbi:MAG: orotate phosphoribosyltransferase [Endomicrobiales bacterium]